MCRAVIAEPLRRIVQDDGRIRHWGHVILPDEAEARILRAVTLEDGATLQQPCPEPAEGAFIAALRMGEE